MYNHNLTASNDAELSVDVHHVMPTFITQLKKLLGLPELVIKAIYLYIVCVYVCAF